MHILSRQYLLGVNRWFRDRTLAALIAELPDEAIPPGLLRMLVEALDRLPVSAHQTGSGERMQRALPSGASWGCGLIELAAELQFLSSDFLGERREQRTPVPGTVQVALECPELPLAEACLSAAVQIGVRLQRGEPLDLAKVY
jgi:hypothetical protein